jgi:hypothetical protein
MTKPCSCGRVYSLTEWVDLHLVGSAYDSTTYRIEMRNCPCGSTLGWPMICDFYVTPAEYLDGARSSAPSEG